MCSNNIHYTNNVRTQKCSLNQFTKKCAQNLVNIFEVITQYTSFKACFTTKCAQ